MNRLVATAWLLLCTSSAASAQLNCMVPTRERLSGGGIPLNSAALAPIRRAAQAAEAIVKRDTSLMVGARPVRVRTTIDYAPERPWTANVFTGVYNEEAWVGACDLSPFADRGGGLRDGTLRITINEPRAFLGYPSGGDSELEAFEAPELTGYVAGFPVYRDATGTSVLIVNPGLSPWIPVTIAEALAHEERRLKAAQGEWVREKARPWITAAKVQQCYDTMKAVAPALVEDACAPVRQARADEQAQRPKREADTDADFAARYEDLRAYRAAFTAQQLQEPASPNGRRPSGIARVDDPGGLRLVKVNPAFRLLHSQHVHLLGVHRVVGPATDPVAGRHAWMMRSVEALDYAALAALLETR